MYVYAKFHHNIPLSSRDSAIITFFQNLEVGKASTNEKCHFAISWARSCQYQCLGKVYQNIPLSLRDRAIFTFLVFGARQSLDRR